MKRILLSIGTLALVGVVAVGATTAFFSDTETSEGNTFTAGSIDLLMSNESYLQTNGEIEKVDDLSWNVGDLGDIEDGLFFSFDDVKPGDLGEDTITLEVNSNNSWACMKGEVKNRVSGGHEEATNNDGHLPEEIQLAFWVDDGDNVYEGNEEIVWEGTAEDLFDGKWQSIADAEESILEEAGENVGEKGELIGEEEYHIAKAWCHGDLKEDASEEGDDNPQEREETGFTCDGGVVGNASQGDSFDVDVEFHAVQSRNNMDFECSSLDEIGEGGENNIDESSVQNYSPTGWSGWSCPTDQTAVGGTVLVDGDPIDSSLLEAEGVAEPGANIGGETYPDFPHYTYNESAGETGYVAQMGGTVPTGDVTIQVECQIN